MKKIGLIAALLFAQTATAAPNQSENLDRLRAQFSAIDQEERKEIHWGAGAIAASGVGLGIAAISAGDPSNQRKYGWEAGSMVALGGLLWGLSGLEKSASEKFAEMPERTEKEKAEKLEFGESYLNERARDARNARICAAAIMLPGAAAFLGAYALRDNKENHGDFLAVGALMAAGGIYAISGKSQAEKAKEGYQSWKEGRAAQAWKTSIIPLKGGALASVAWSF